jgi:hypothetical protein
LECIEDTELEGRFKAQQLKKKENLSLAEKLIIASNEDKFAFTYKGIEIEVWSPTKDDFAKFVELYNKVLIDGEEQKLSKEESEAVEDELFLTVSKLCIDDSIDLKLLQSGMLGTSFIPKLMNELQEYQKREVEEVTAVKGFRRESRR